MGKATSNRYSNNILPLKIYCCFFEEYERDILFLKYEISVWGWQIQTIT